MGVFTFGASSWVLKGSIRSVFGSWFRLLGLGAEASMLGGWRLEAPISAFFCVSLGEP